MAHPSAPIVPIIYDEIPPAGGEGSLLADVLRVMRASTVPAIQSPLLSRHFTNSDERRQFVQGLPANFDHWGSSILDMGSIARANDNSVVPHIVNSWGSWPDSAAAHGAAPTSESVPLYRRLYPDSSYLLWESENIFRLQKSLTSRSALVEDLLREFKRAAHWLAHATGKILPQIEQMKFVLDASAEVVDNVRRYVFYVTEPARGDIMIDETMVDDRHLWRHWIQVGDAVVTVRDVTDAVMAHASKVPPPIVDIQVVRGEYKRSLEI